MYMYIYIYIFGVGDMNLHKEVDIGNCLFEHIYLKEKSNVNIRKSSL